MVLCLVLRKVMSLLVEDLFCSERIMVMRGWDACDEFGCTFVTHSEKLAVFLLLLSYCIQSRFT
jgi:hypothetical protein